MKSLKQFSSIFGKNRLEKERSEGKLTVKMLFCNIMMVRTGTTAMVIKRKQYI